MIACPECGRQDTAVVDSRPHAEGRLRYRKCQCGGRFPTLEVVLHGEETGNTRIAHRVRRYSPDQVAALKSLSDTLSVLVDDMSKG